MADTGHDGAPVVIKKYANRRLYNTATSSYVTLDHLCAMVRDGTEFVVQDAKSGEDITGQVLTQIIVEQEAKGETLLPIGFLRQLIRLYDDSLRSLVPGYLEQTMAAFTHNREELRARVEKTTGGAFPLAELEAMGRKNMAHFQNALRAFTPFATGASGAPEPPEAPGASPASGSDELAALKRQLDEMQDRIDALARKARD